MKYKKIYSLIMAFLMIAVVSSTVATSKNIEVKLEENKLEAEEDFKDQKETFSPVSSFDQILNIISKSLNDFFILNNDENSTIVETVNVSNVDNDSAILTGRLNQFGWDTWFRYRKNNSGSKWEYIDTNGKRIWERAGEFIMDSGNILDSDTEYEFQACADRNFLRMENGESMYFKTDKDPVATIGVYNIQRKSATFKGELNTKNWDTWFRYRENDGKSNWSYLDTNGNGRWEKAGVFTMETGEVLEPNTEYEYQAAADNNLFKVMYGDSKFFKTLGGFNPVVNTVGHLNLDTNSVTLEGELNYFGWDTWFRYRVDDGESNWTYLDTNGNGSWERKGVFSMNTGDVLNSNTTYEFQACADKKIGLVKYGISMYFTTFKEHVITDNAWDIDNDSAVLNGTLNYDNWDTWFRYRVYDNDSNWTYLDTNGNGRWEKTGKFSMNTSDVLEANTTYEFQACADNNLRTIKYGEKKLFLTKVN